MKKVILGIVGIAIIGIGLWLILGGKVEKAKPVQKEEAKEGIKEEVPKPPAPAEQHQQIELELVETIKLPEGVKDVILDEETGRPAIFLKEDAIQFLNEDMKVRKEYKLPCPLTPNEQECWTRVEFSKGNKFIGVNTIRKYEKETVEEAEFVMLDKDGNEVWRRKHNYYSIIPSPNGEYFLGFEDPSCGGCPIKIVDKQGKIAEIDATRYTKTEFSPDGRYFVNATDGYRGSKSFVRLYDQYGHEIWQRTPKEIGLPDIPKDTWWQELILLDTGEVCILYEQHSLPKTFLILFEQNGSLRWKKEEAGLLRYRVKKVDKKSLILFSGNGGVKKIDRLNGETIWEWQEQKENTSLGYYKISPRGNYMGIYIKYTTGPPQYNFISGKFFLLTKDGQKIFEKEVTLRQFSYSQNEEEFYIQTEIGIEKNKIMRR